jgi:hypothetical protein
MVVAVKEETPQGRKQNKTENKRNPSHRNEAETNHRRCKFGPRKKRTVTHRWDIRDEQP